MKIFPRPIGSVLFASFLSLASTLPAAESPYIYGIFGFDPSTGEKDNYDTDPRRFLEHVYPAGPGWATVTFSIGHDSNNVQNITQSDLTWLSNDGPGNTVICRLNNGYFPNGSIPFTNYYGEFAQTCAKFVQSSRGCSIWTIGNELNVQGEWPYDPASGKMDYLSPASYAWCFTNVYKAIKSLPGHTNDLVLPEAPAAGSGGGPANAGFIGSYTGTNYNADCQPYNWVQHLSLVLQAITNKSGIKPDGIALHIPASGYNCSDVHNTASFNSGTIACTGSSSQTLFSDFYVYVDAVTKGIPLGFRNLPLYATECNGNQSWNNYSPGWMQAIYDEINHYNQWASFTNGPVFHCVNMYRWYQYCDAASLYEIKCSYQKDQILYDLDQAVAHRYVWPTNTAMLLLPIGINFLNPSDLNADSVSACSDGPTVAGAVPQTGWVNLSQGGNGSSVGCGGGVAVTWSSPGGTHTMTAQPSDGANYSLMRGYLDDGDSTTKTMTMSGLKFPLYDILAYSDGDNGSATRVTKFTLSGSGITTISKYVRDDANVNFSGTFNEADSTSGGVSTQPGNYCRFHNLRAASFTLTSTGEYNSDGHPRGPLNALQVVPIDVRPTLSNPGYSGGLFTCYLNGAANVNYAITASSNLVNWVRISTNTAPSQVTVPGSSNTPYRFYRALFL